MMGPACAPPPDSFHGMLSATTPTHGSVPATLSACASLMVLDRSLKTQSTQAGTMFG